MIAAYIMDASILRTVFLLWVKPLHDCLYLTTNNDNRDFFLARLAPQNVSVTNTDTTIPTLCCNKNTLT